MDKQFFSNGYCLEFAYALQKQDPQLEIGLIGANFYDDVFEEEVFEASHAVIIDPKDNNYCYDCLGRRKVSDINCLFNNNITTEPFMQPSENITEAESFLGEMEPEALLNAELYIRMNSELFTSLYAKKDPLLQYLDNNISSSYQGFKKVLIQCIDNNKNQSKQQTIIQLQESIDLFLRYKNNFKNHIKRVSKQKETGEKIFDPYYVNINDCKTFEDILDCAQKIKSYDDTIKYAKSFLRSYKDLAFHQEDSVLGGTFNIINPKTLSLFNVLRNKELPREEISQKLRKVASFNDTEELNTVLQQIINQYSDTYENKLSALTQSQNVEILFSKDNVICAKILNFAASTQFGSPEWCISTHADYYDSYLLNVTNDTIPSLSFTSDETTESIMEGSHFFYWDFNLSEEKQLSQFAFTLSSAGHIVAAHDKSDNDILPNIKDILGDNLNTVILKGITYNEKYINQYLESISGSESDIFDYGDLLINTCKHPLNMFTKIIKTLDLETFDFHNELIVESALLTYSLQQFSNNNDNEISAAQMIEDCLFFNDFMEKYFTNLDYQGDEYREDEDEYEDEYEEEVQTPYQTDYTSGDVFLNKTFSTLLKSITNEEKNDITNKYKESLLALHHTEILFKNYHSTGINSLEGSYCDIKGLSPIFSEISENLLLNSDLAGNKTHLLITSHVLHAEHKNPEIEKLFIEMIEQKNIYANKVLFNINEYSEELRSNIINLINNSPDIISEICINTLNVLSRNDRILSSLSKETCKRMNQHIHSNPNIDLAHNSIQQPQDGEYNLINRLKKLFDCGIIDHEIVEKRISDSKIFFGNKEFKANNNSELYNLKDYICQSKSEKTNFRCKNN